MKKTKKLLLTLSTFLCVLFSNASCMVNQNGKRPAGKQAVALNDSSKKLKPNNSFVRPVSDVGELIFEQSEEVLKRELEIQELLKFLESISDPLKRDAVVRSMLLRAIESIANSEQEQNLEQEQNKIIVSQIIEEDLKIPRKLTIDSKSFISAISDAGLELQREEEVEFKECLKELLFDKTNEEFIQGFVTAYFKIIENSGADLTKEGFKKNLSMLFLRMLLNDAHTNFMLRFSMVYSLILQEHLFFHNENGEKLIFIRDESHYLISTMCWVLSEIFLYDEFYKTIDYFNLLFPDPEENCHRAFDFLYKEERSSLSSVGLAEHLMQQELNILNSLNWHLYFSPDQIKDFVEAHFK